MSNQNNAIFQSLYENYRPMVFQMCMGFVNGDNDQAKDLTQDVFINIWNSLDKFRGDSNYKTWVYSTTVNTCLKYIRDKKDKNCIPIHDEAHKLADDASTATDKEYKTLYQAISKLNEIDRLLIMLVLDDLEYDEISEIMGISPVNLRVKIHRIKKNLKNILENEQ